MDSNKWCSSSRLASRGVKKRPIEKCKQSSSMSTQRKKTITSSPTDDLQDEVPQYSLATSDATDHLRVFNVVPKLSDDDDSMFDEDDHAVYMVCSTRASRRVWRSLRMSSLTAAHAWTSLQRRRSWTCTHQQVQRLHTRTK